MNVYKVSYAAVTVSGEGPNQTRSAKEGTLIVLADNPTAAGEIAASNVPADEFHVHHAQELGKNVIQAGQVPVVETVAEEFTSGNE